MIHGIAGSIGSGKSHLQLKVALEIANNKEKQLVCNFPLDREGLKEYATYKKYNWILRLLRHGGISEIYSPDKLEELLLPESVACIDEAGIYLNAREFQKTSKKLLYGLCMSRHYGTDLVWCSQFLEQVDNQFRLLTQYWTYADSMTYYSHKHRRPQLFYKRYYWMDATTFYSWNGNLKARSNHFRTRFAFSYRYEGGFLNKADMLLFNCFDSMFKPSSINPYARIETMYTCPRHIPQGRWVSDFGNQPPEDLALSPNFSALSDYKAKNPDKFPDKSLTLLSENQETTEEEDMQLVLDLFPSYDHVHKQNNVLYIPDRLRYKQA